MNETTVLARAAVIRYYKAVAAWNRWAARGDGTVNDWLRARRLRNLEAGRRKRFREALAAR